MYDGTVNHGADAHQQIENQIHSICLEKSINNKREYKHTLIAEKTHEPGFCVPSACEIPQQRKRDNKYCRGGRIFEQNSNKENTQIICSVIFKNVHPMI